jgi:hypothetical protein
MLRSLLVTGLALALGLIAGGAEEPDPALAKARGEYYDTTDKAKAALLGAFASAIKNATAAGNLDAVKALRAEKEAFETGGRLPSSMYMKTPAANYQAALKQAALILEKAYEQSIKDLTKAGKLKQAEDVRAELKSFRSKAPATNLRPADVTTKEDLQKYLSDTAWAWDDGLKLRSDGSTEQKNWDMRGLVTKWETVDRRTAVLWIEKGRDNNRTATLVFNEDLTEATGFSFDGARIKGLKRKP